MSDLGAIFHVKKSGTQYDAHAYTTTDECPEPNLKVKFKGTAAYVKLEAKGSGDVPCYVKKGDGGVFQVKKETGTPTGHTIIMGEGTFTVPSGIYVIELAGDFHTIYLGVTPNTTHSIYIDIIQQGHVHFEIQVGCTSHNRVYKNDDFFSEEEEEPSDNILISWSPEINKIAPTVTDY
jgi:hypothetical protein|nr:MAG TPA: hypothetical protein [Caudoviricetes sp.]